MKYKRLSKEELQELEPEFVTFLATQQITAPEWVELKKYNMERVEALIDNFSDMVYENVLQKIQYIEHLDPRDLMIFHCKENSLHMVGIQLSEECGLDLSDPDFFNQWEQAPETTGISIYSKEKPYSEPREMVVFQLLQSGCNITNDKLFNTLLLHSKQS